MPGHYLGYSSKRKNFMNEALTPYQIPGEVLAVIHSYAFLNPIEFIDQISISSKDKNPNDPATLAQAYAQWAIDQAYRLIHLGRGNIHEDVVRTKGETFVLRNFIDEQYKKMKSDSGFTDQMKSLTNNNFLLQNSLSLSALAITHGAGNCHEFSLVAMNCLLTLQRILKDDYTKAISGMSLKYHNLPNGDSHVFIEINIVGKNSKETIICDPWSKFAGSSADATQFKLFDMLAREFYNQANKTYMNNGDINKMMEHMVRYEYSVFDLLESFHNDIKPQHTALQYLLGWLKIPPEKSLLTEGIEIAKAISKNPGQNKKIYSEPQTDKPAQTATAALTAPTTTVTLAPSN